MNERKKEIRRNVLLFVSSIVTIVGFIITSYAISINHNGIATDDGEVIKNFVVGFVLFIIGIGGIYYEEDILSKRRNISCRRNVSINK